MPFKLLEKGLRHPRRVPAFLSTNVKRQILRFRSNHDAHQVHALEREWDLMLVLDACRVDSLTEVAPEYDFLPDDIESVVSVAAGSPGWLARTFSQNWCEEVTETSYISANPHARRVLGEAESGRFSDRGSLDGGVETFEHFDPVWEDAWDEAVGTVPARAVTDRLVEYCRSRDSERVVAHYMQPHFPSVPEQVGEGMDINSDADWAPGSTWSLVRQGELDIQAAYAAYLENLRYVLNEVAIVLDNVDAERVVVTADHGNAFGEWGMFGHGQSHLNVVRTVPWVELSAKDNETHIPDIRATNEEESESESVEEKLRALGYRT